MNTSEFVDGISLIEAQLGKSPCSDAMFERWVEVKLKPLAHLSHARWIQVAEAAVNELSFWNQLTSFWVLNKASELARPERSNYLPASPGPAPSPCPAYVKIWMAEEKKRFESMPKSEITAYQLSRGVLPAGGMVLTDEIRAEMHFIRDRIAGEGLTAEDAALIRSQGFNIEDAIASIAPAPPKMTVEVWE